MAQVLDSAHVSAYNAGRDANEDCLVARVWTPTDRKLFRVSPEHSSPATVRVHNGEPTCGGKCSGGSCVHVKAYLAYIDSL